MTKDVTISIRGIQFAEGNGDDSIETVQQGEYFFKNEGHYLLYDEYEEGYHEPVKNMLRFKDGELTLTKRGLLNVQMIFAVGKKNLSHYQTPYGAILMGMDTSKITFKEQEHAIFLDVEYTLEANYQYVADCHIAIEVWDRGYQNMYLRRNAKEAEGNLGS